MFSSMLPDLARAFSPMISWKLIGGGELPAGNATDSKKLMANSVRSVRCSTLKPPFFQVGLHVVRCGEEAAVTVSRPRHRESKRSVIRPLKNVVNYEHSTRSQDAPNL